MYLFLLVHGFFPKEDGQTVGKKVIGIRIADLYNDVPSLQTLIPMRYLPIWMVTIIPRFGGVASIVNVLFVIRNDRQCIHDITAELGCLPQPFIGVFGPAVSQVLK